MAGRKFQRASFKTKQRQRLTELIKNRWTKVNLSKLRMKEFILIPPLNYENKNKRN
jgi:hypothetical protein